MDHLHGVAVDEGKERGAEGDGGQGTLAFTQENAQQDAAEEELFAERREDHDG